MLVCAVVWHAFVKHEIIFTGYNLAHILLQVCFMRKSVSTDNINQFTYTVGCMDRQVNIKGTDLIAQK